MSNQLFNPQLVSLKQNAYTWEEAIKLSCVKLLENEYITAEYSKSIIDVVNENGPYFVLLDYFALPHSNKFSAVIKSGLAITTLENEVLFPNNKSVKVLCTLAAKDEYEHLSLLQELAKLLQKPNIIQRLCKVNNQLQLKKLMEEL